MVNKSSYFILGRAPFCFLVFVFLIAPISWGSNLRRCEAILMEIAELDPLGAKMRDTFPILTSFNGPFANPKKVFEHPDKEKIKSLAGQIPVDIEGKTQLTDSYMAAYEKYSDMLRAMQIALAEAESAVGNQIVKLGEQLQGGHITPKRAAELFRQLDDYRNELRKTYLEERNEWLKVFPAIGVATDQRLDARLQTLDESPLDKSDEVYSVIYKEVGCRTFFAQINKLLDGGLQERRGLN